MGDEKGNNIYSALSARNFSMVDLPERFFNSINIPINNTFSENVDTNADTDTTNNNNTGGGGNAVNNSNLGKCYVGGCSSHICTDMPPGQYASTCEWKEEYACYRTAKCERQATGQCGWTETAELKACIDEKSNEPVGGWVY